MIKEIPINVKDEIKQLQLPPSFAEAHITVRESLPNNVFLLNNGDLGVVYQIDGVYDEPLTERDLQDAFNPYFKYLRQIVLGIPTIENKENVVIQVICSQRVEDQPLIKKDKKGNCVSYSDSEIGKLLDFEEKSTFKIGLLSRKFYLAVRFITDKNKADFINKVTSVFDLFKAESSIESQERKKYEQNLENFEIALEPLELELKIHYPIKRLTNSELFAYYQDVLHGANPKTHIFPNISKDIHSNIYNPIIKTSPSSLKVEIEDENKDISVFCLGQLPQEYSLGMMREFIDAIPMKTWDLVWVYSHGTSSAPVGHLLWWFKTGNEEKYKDLKDFKNSTHNLSPCGVQSLRLIGYNVSKAHSSQLQSVSLDYLGARFIPEKQIAVHMVSTSLPLGCSPHQNKVAGRYKSIKLEHALGFLPLYKGPEASAGTRWWASRTCLPARFDLFAGEGNRMTAILGRGRAGKSCLTTQLLLEFMDRHPQGIVRFIDRKTSYKKLADLYGGKIIQFSEENLKTSPYSPFALKTWDSDDIENVFVIIASAIVQKNKNINFSAVHSEILLEAIKIAYNNQTFSNIHAQETGSPVSPHPIWGDIKACLDQAAEAKGLPSTHCEDISKWTVSLEETGQYGFIFSRHETSGVTTENAKFIVYDLDGIADPVLRVLAGQMAFLKITRDLAKQPKSYSKLLGLDEFGMLVMGDDEPTRDMNNLFVKNVVKTAAKYNTVVMSITNDVADYAEIPAGKTMWQQSTNKLFLPLGRDMVSSLQKAYPTQFNTAEWQILESLNISAEKKRSEVYVKCEGESDFKGSLLIPLTPFMDALVTTSPTPCEFYEDLIHQGKSPLDAITYMAEKHPYGDGMITKTKESNK